MKVGDVYASNYCGDFEIIEYIKYKMQRVKFLGTGYETWCAGKEILKGSVRDPLSNTVRGVASLGEGLYLPKNKEKGRMNPAYSCWYSMIDRCYFKEDISYRFYGAKGVTVCDEWLCFQNFARWYHINHKDKQVIDKDILSITSNNKEYNSKVCRFIPSRINKMLRLTHCQGKEEPVGVNKTAYGKFKAAVNDVDLKRNKTLGIYDTPEEAFVAYKKAKEEIIKRVAISSYNSGEICKDIYEALIKYEVKPYG